MLEWGGFARCVFYRQETVIFASVVPSVLITVFRTPVSTLTHPFALYFPFAKSPKPATSTLNVVSPELALVAKLAVGLAVKPQKSESWLSDKVAIIALFSVSVPDPRPSAPA